MQTPEIKGIAGLRFELAFTALKAYDLKAGSLGPITPSEKDGYFLAALKTSVNRLSPPHHTRGVVLLTHLPTWVLRRLIATSDSVNSQFLQRKE